MAPRSSYAASPAFMSLTDLVPEAFRLTDRLAPQAQERAAGSGLAIRCRKGCGVCCRYLVRISLPEALFLAARIQDTHQPRREGLLARFGRLREVLQREGSARAQGGTRPGAVTGLRP